MLQIMIPVLGPSNVVSDVQLHSGDVVPDMRSYGEAQ